MSIFGNIADSHSAKINAEKKAAEERAKQQLNAHTKFEQEFSEAVTNRVLPYYNRLMAEIIEKGFSAEVYSGRDGYGRLHADLKFVPTAGQSLTAVPLDVCVFRINANTGELIAWTSYFNQRNPTHGSSQGQLSFAELSETGLENYLKDFFARSFEALPSK